MANSSEEQLRVWAAEAFYWITSSESTSRRTCLVSIIGTRSCPNINQCFHSIARFVPRNRTEARATLVPCVCALILGRPALGTSTTVRFKLFLHHLRSSSTVSTVVLSLTRSTSPRYLVPILLTSTWIFPQTETVF